MTEKSFANQGTPAQDWFEVGRRDSGEGEHAREVVYQKTQASLNGWQSRYDPGCRKKTRIDLSLTYSPASYRHSRRDDKRSWILHLDFCNGRFTQSARLQFEQLELIGSKAHASNHICVARQQWSSFACQASQICTAVEDHSLLA